MTLIKEILEIEDIKLYSQPAFIDVFQEEFKRRNGVNPDSEDLVEALDAWNKFKQSEGEA